MAPSFLSGSNPVLVRELRAGLRSVRAFALLALYVALLGAIVTVYFPAGKAIDLQSDGGAKGQGLFWTLVWGQVFLILMMIPALATGALAQERERQTLEPLLLTPLSPLQIVWGKAGGVLSLVGLLLVASLPLTSLCFLLGGVSPGMLIAAYCGIFGLAMFTTGFGLYCAARWLSATRALMACYAMLPIALALVVVFLPLGSLFSGLCVIALIFYGLFQGWKKGESSNFAQRVGPLYGKVIYVLAPLLFIGLLLMMKVNLNFGLIVFGIGFVLAYFVMAAQWGLLQTARELMLRNDPEEPLRQKIADFKSDWQSAVAPPVVSTYTPAPQTQSEWATLTRVPPPPAAAPSTIRRGKKEDTYGKEPFLSDKVNPIFAREMRSGLLGKLDYLFRFTYVLTILSEVGLLIFMLQSIYNPTSFNDNYVDLFAGWGRLHLPLVMIFGAWFGARAIAPEREGQTLPQLFTIPMHAQSIISGKLASVLAFTFYVQVLALPMAILLPGTGMVPWPMAWQFLACEAVLGVVAAAWGTYCSFHCGTVRSALSWSLGGVGILVIAHLLAGPLLDFLSLLGGHLGKNLAIFLTSFLPIPLLFSSVSGFVNGDFLNKPDVHMVSALPALGLYAAVAIGLVLKTSRDFRKLAREA